VKKANDAEMLLALVDLAPEPSKNMTKGSDNSRKTRKKSKLKKHKNQGKAMDEVYLWTLFSFSLTGIICLDD
jgi:hypothetical protein